LATKSDLRRWSGWLALVLAFSVACVMLSNWQFSRREEALSEMAQVAIYYDAVPTSIDSVAELNAFDEKNQWRPVQMTGHYLVKNAVLVRNRPLNGQPGFLELVPFQLSDGRLIAIERGWIASDDKYQAPNSFPLPSSSEQTIIARLRPSEPSLERSAPEGQLATINIDALIKAEGIKDRMFSKLYARISSESVPVANNPKSLAKPELDEGNHLSYALQWIMFSLMSIAALYWGIKKERQAKSGVKPLKPKRKILGEKDAEAEDAFLLTIS
jgi:cytochrome oxidase assembly protein ShyY1